MCHTVHMNIASHVSSFFTPFPERHYERGDVLIRGEQQPAGVFYLVSGLVTQYDIAANGNEVVVNVFKPGAFFPMSWAINQTHNRYYFEAAAHTTVRVAPADEVVEFLRHNPDVMYDLLSRVYRGTDGVLRRMAHLMGGDAKHRLLFELMNAAQRFGEIQADGQIVIRLNEGDIASRSGLARETVNRVLQAFKQSGLVEIRQGALCIKDLAALQAQLGDNL